MSASPSVWLRPPRLRTLTDQGQERHATWFELFFDLVFVAAVSQLATALSRDTSLAGFARFAGLFVPVGWAWAGFTFYANRFDTDDVVYRLVKAGAMLAVASLAISIHSVMQGGHGSVDFAVSYVVIRVCLLLLYARARWHERGPGRRLIDVYLAGFSVGAAIWLVSVAVPVPARYWLWGAAVAIELAIPPLGWRALSHPAINAPHLTERYGGFFIIVLGESVVSVVAGVADTRFSAAASAVAIAGFAIALCLWWIYFDLVDTSVVGRGLLGLVYVYAHFPLLAGVAALAAGTKLAITHADAPHLGSGVRWAIGGGLVCYLLSLAVLHIAAEWSSTRDRSFLGRLAASAVAIALAACGGALSPVLFVTLLAGMLVAQLILELSTYPAGAASVLPDRPTIAAPQR